MRLSSRRSSAESFVICSVLAIVLCAAALHAQPIRAAPDSAQRVSCYLDCPVCDNDYIRQTITLVDWVRDVAFADVYILVASRQTGGNGQMYTLFFTGLRRFGGMADTLACATHPAESDEEVRRDIERRIAIGLARYVARTPEAGKIAIALADTAALPVGPDPWDYWVYTASFSAAVNGQQSTHSVAASGAASANRVTDALKINISASYGYNQNYFLVNGAAITSYYKTDDFNVFSVASAGAHWSVGGMTDVSGSTYNNLKTGVAVQPALEYDVFPYSEYATRGIFFVYRIGYNYYRYYDTTIYDKIAEAKPSESLSLYVSYKQIWGSASASAAASHFIDDPTKYNIQLSANLSYRLYEGLSATLNGQVSFIHDQISLPRLGATVDQVLLERLEIATNYSYGLNIGVSYTFGSIYNNIVNPRL